MGGAIKQLVLQLNWFPLNKSQFEQILLQFFLQKPSFVLNTTEPVSLVSEFSPR